MSKTGKNQANTTQLLHKSRQIQEHAEKFLRHSGLLKILAKYGQARVVGACAMKTMLEPDIDLLVQTANQSPSTLSQLTQALLATRYFQSVVYKNMYMSLPARFVSLRGESSPRGHYWAIRTERGKQAWHIDIWMVRPSDATFNKDLGRYKEMLTGHIGQTRRALILQIKSWVSDTRQNRRAVPSALIYHAVLEEDIGSIEEFQFFLKRFSADV